jgi:hypothetical protein
MESLKTIASRTRFAGLRDRVSRSLVPGDPRGRERVAGGTRGGAHATWVLRACLCLGLLGSGRLLGQTPALAGRWTLNIGLSDRGGDMIQPADTAGGKAIQGFSRDGGLGGGGFGGGGLGHGSHHGATPSPYPLTDQQRARMRQTLDIAINAPSTLTITETDSAMTFEPDTAAPLVVLGNDSKQIVKVPDGGDIEVRGYWQGHAFAVERKVAGGGRVTEDYFLSADAKQLYVVVGFEGAGGRSVMFRRIYDPAPAN